MTLALKNISIFRWGIFGGIFLRVFHGIKIWVWHSKCVLLEVEIHHHVILWFLVWTTLIIKIIVGFRQVVQKILPLKWNFSLNRTFVGSRGFIADTLAPLVILRIKDYFQEPLPKKIFFCTWLLWLYGSKYFRWNFTNPLEFGVVAKAFSVLVVLKH